MRANLARLVMAASVMVVAQAIACGTEGGGSNTDAGVVEISVSDPAQFYASPWRVLTPAIHLPSSDASRDQVSVLVRMRDGASVSHVETPHGPVLAWPAGTEFARAEWVGRGAKRGLVDVRGTKILEQGKARDYTLRRTSFAPNAPLVGFEWPQGDAAAHKDATQKLVDLMRGYPPATKFKQAKRRRRYLDGLRKKNDCGRCHQALRPPNNAPDEHGLVDRGTDHNGFFTPSTLFSDELPLERYATHNRSVGGEFVTVGCSDGSAPADPSPKAKARVRCKSGVPVARLDVKAAVRAEHPHALELCASRHWLFERLDPSAKAVFGEAMTPCGP